MNERIILDLCGGTGAWSNPYRDAGYDVRVITLPNNNVLTYHPPKNVYGILAAPPCTMFSHARTIAKLPRDLKGAMDIIRACKRIVAECQYNTQTGDKVTSLKFWAMENPNKGLMPKFEGLPAFIFEPWEFGDPYTKQTALWGYFNAPRKTHTIKPPTVKFDRLKTKEIHPELYGKYNRTERRAVTPQGFAKAFYEANK